MKEQGRSTFSTGEDGRILDRLAGLEKVIPPEVLKQVLADTGRVNGRACPLTHQVMLWLVLAMGLLTNMPIRQVFKHARRFRLAESTPTRSALCMARQRLGAEPLRLLHARVARPLATPDTPGAFYRDWRLMGIDGTLLNDPQRTGHQERHRLLTNLLDETECPALELILLYHERWEEELVFDEQKTHQDPRRAEKPAQLRSESPEGVEQELYALSLGHFVVRSLMLAAAESAKLDVDRLSFTGCFRILQCRLPECRSETAASLD